jgi:hypothetical protein
MLSKDKINPKSIPGKVEMWSDTDDVSWMVFVPGSEIDEQDIHAILDLVKTTLEPGEELLALIDIRKMETITTEARTLAASKENESIYKAMAIVATSPAMRLIAKFFINFHKPPRPTQIFSNPEEAKTWLMDFRVKKANRSVGS